MTNLFDFFDLFLNSYNFFIHFLVETVLVFNILNFIWFTPFGAIAIIFLTRGPSLETIRNVAMTLGGLSTFAIATGVGGPRRNRAEEEAAKKEAQEAKEEARKAQDSARRAREEAAQTKAGCEAMQNKIAEFEARLAAKK
jgi:hypothetical protein